MTELLVIVPSRGRPEAATELTEAFRATCTTDTHLLFVVDESDPTRDDYLNLPHGLQASTLVAPSTTMVEALNLAAGHAVSSSRNHAIGFMGDDHRPRTIGWDAAYVGALLEMRGGIVYGNDLLQGENLPTQCAMTGDIVRALGYMCPPELTHLCVDNFWLDLGRAAGCIRYLPEVVVEHMHPLAAKAEWDEGHLRVNDPAMYHRDRAAYALYRGDRFTADVAKVKALRAAS